jgi:bacterial/archaeal transporter family protein
MGTWMLLAALSAVFAALVAVLAKVGLKEVDPLVATAVRAVVMAAAITTAVAGMGRAGGLTRVPQAALGWIVLSGLAGAASWVCYFYALRSGPAGAVAALDRLSIVVTLLLAAAFLKERLTPASLAGGALIVAGALLIAWKR